MLAVLSDYVQKHALYPAHIDKKPASDLGICVVVPCFNEENITGILQCLYDCNRPNVAVEVLVVLNAPENASNDIRQRHKQLTSDFNEWKEQHPDKKIQYYLIKEEFLPLKDAGVGLARKIGMDEAVYRFLQCHQAHGVIANIDADCTCAPNYLTELEKLFNQENINACSIRFEHPMQGNDFDEEVYKDAVQYELYLHYYMLALKNIGHPFAFHTVGSCFAVRTDVYCKQGGMNKRKAGEDFYFLQKVIPLGHYAELNTTCVYPSPRPSLRVPFGTGASIDKMLKNHDSCYYTYDIHAFEDLSVLLSCIPDLFYKKNIVSVPEPLHSFLVKYEMNHHVAEIIQNTSTIKTFTLRFYRWFNAFMVLKYMNYSHAHFYQKRPVEEMAVALLKKYKPNESVSLLSPEEILVTFRKWVYKL